MKKTIALILAMLLLSLLAACGGNATDAPSQPQSSPATEAPAPSTAEEAEAGSVFKAYIQDISAANRSFLADDFIMITSGDTALREQYQLTDEDIRARGEDPEYAFLDDYETVNLDETKKRYQLNEDCVFEVLGMAMGSDEDPFQSVPVSFEAFEQYNSFPCDITLAADGTVMKISQYFVP